MGDAKERQTLFLMCDYGTRVVDKMEVCCRHLVRHVKLRREV